MLISLLLSMALTAGPTTAAADSLPAFARFLSGRWNCAGGTPSGRAMAATLSFSTTLSDRWFVMDHADAPPGRYLAHALWPTTETASPIAMVLYDNGGTMRRFESPGWTPDSVIWTRDSTDVKARPERFSYRRSSDASFLFAWHVRAPDGRWILGDSLVCRR